MNAISIDEAKLKVSGKFLYHGSEKFYVKGVSYGWFPPEENEGIPYPRPAIVREDFEMMRKAGINTVRTFDPPPEYVLDIADEVGMKVIVGVWIWHKYVFDDSKTLTHFKEVVSETVRRCMAHPCIIIYCIGSEIPSEIVMWYGNNRIEKFLFELYTTAKRVDPDCLVTYANFPPTEYLNLDFLDITSFNVYIYYEDGFRAYLPRLQNIAGDKPLLLGEIGVDSLRNGETTQAKLLEWKIKATFEEGLCGVVIFKWTDQWWRGGNLIRDWKFGIVDEQRKPKKAYHVVSSLFPQPLHALLTEPPFISVVVATYNGERTLRECLDSLNLLNYPKKEVIVVDDGSTDATASIAQDYVITLLRNERNQGLSVARNVGITAANGDIVAFTDADCRVDPNWLFYIATALTKKEVAAVGGPNLTPPDDGFFAHRTSEALGVPRSVLIDDREAEHIPGCNMAFKKTVFDEVGRFDPRFRTAGDDVDMCWRLREKGYRIEYAPGAVVWHHRRNSIKAYFKQQFGYGVAEAQLGKKHPKKYGHHGLKWIGKLYGAIPVLSFSRPRIYYAPFPYVYMPIYGVLSHLPLTFDWYLLAALLLILTPLSLWFLLPSSILICTSMLTCVMLARKASKKTYNNRGNKMKNIATIALLNFLWPIARGLGRIYGKARHISASNVSHI